MRRSSTEPHAPPSALARLQRAFGEAVSTPIAPADGSEGWRTRTESYPALAVAAVVPRGDKDSAARIATYNQQYWFRLFTVMQREFPLLRHLLGVEGLNRLATAYLECHPPRSPSLRDLSNHLETFLAGDVPWNAPIIRECARLERVHIVAFDAAHARAIEFEAPGASSELLEQPLRFQAHWHLFEEHWNLVRLRELVGDDADDEIEVEPAAEHGYWAIYRVGKRIVSERLGPLQFELLEALAGGAALGAACERQAAELDEQQVTFVRGHIRDWFGRWASLGWFRAS